MKYILTILFLLGIHLHLFAQKENSISVAYFGNFAIQPGLKIGSQFNFKTWEKDKFHKKDTITKLQKLFVSPQFTIFTRPERNTNYLINVDLGYQFQNKERKLYQAVSLGLGYLLQSELLSFSVNLGSGETSNKNRESRHFFLPTLNYELGGYIGQERKFAWYTKYGLGSKLFGEIESSMLVFLELGAKIFFRKK